MAQGFGFGIDASGEFYSVDPGVGYRQQQRLLTR